MHVYNPVNGNKVDNTSGMINSGIDPTFDNCKTIWEDMCKIMKNWFIFKNTY